MKCWEQFWDASMTDTKEADEDLADKLYRESLYFKKETQINDAVRVCDEIIDAFSGTRNPKIKILVAKALFDKGYYLGEYMNNYQKAIPAFDTLITTYQYEESDEFVVQIVKAMFYKGYGLGEIKQYKQGVMMQEILESKYINIQNEEVQRYIAKSLLNKGILLQHMYKICRALETFNQMADIYKESKNPEIKKMLKKANDYKSAIMMIMGGTTAVFITAMAIVFFKTNLGKAIFIFATVYCVTLLGIFLTEFLQKRSNKFN